MIKSFKLLPVILLLIIYGLFNIFVMQTIALAYPIVPEKSQSSVVLEPYGIYVKPMTSSDGKITFSETLINLFGDDHPVLVQFQNSKAQNQTSVNFYKDAKSIIGYKLDSSVDYLFFKARLRDDVHEELIGMGFLPSRNPTGYCTVPELFIMGVDDNGKIVRFPIKRYDRLKNAIVDPVNGWDAYHTMFITKEVRTVGKQLLIKSPFAKERPDVKIYWNWTYNCFVIDDLFALYD